MCLNFNLIQKSGLYLKPPLPFKQTWMNDYVIKHSVHCGWCSQCRLSKSTNWLIRNYYESLAHPIVYVFILTYDQVNYDRVKGLLNYSDVQAFHKRMRAAGVSFRFYCSSEYGEKFGRPHHHDLIYTSYKFTDLEFLDYDKDTNRVIYTSPFVNSLWKSGFVRIQVVEHIDFSVLYQTMYLRKFSSFYHTIDNIANAYGIDLRSLFNSSDKSSFYQAIFPYRFHFESSHSSLAVGFKSFMKHGYDSWKQAKGTVYINGFPYQLPYSWLLKLWYEHSDLLAYQILNRLSRDSLKITDEFEMQHKADIYNAKAAPRAVKKSFEKRLTRYF